MGVSNLIIVLKTFGLARTIPAVVMVWLESPQSLQLLAALGHIRNPPGQRKSLAPRRVELNNGLKNNPETMYIVEVFTPEFFLMESMGKYQTRHK